MVNYFSRSVASPGSNVASFANPNAQSRVIQRILPGVARMGTAISVMLLSDGLAFYRTPASKNRLKLEGAAVESSQTVIVAPRLLVSDRPEVSDQPTTHAYRADGYLTGIKSSVIVPQPSARVYDSLSADLHLLFGAIEECKDKVKSEDISGAQILQRYVKIPFTIGYFSGAIKMTMNVANDRPRGEIQFNSSHGKFLSKFLASFTVTSIYGADHTEHTLVELDSRLNVKRLPPPPLKGLVKGVIVRKMDRCMRDLAAFHARLPAECTQATVARQLNNIQSCGNIQRRLNTERRDERPSIL